MKHWFVFSPIIVMASAIPVDIMASKAPYYGYAWRGELGKYYLFIFAPLYAIVAALIVFGLFVTGRWVSRLESGIATAISALLIYVLYQFALGLSHLGMQGAGA